MAVHCSFCSLPMAALICPGTWGGRRPAEVRACRPQRLRCPEGVPGGARIEVSAGWWQCQPSVGCSYGGWRVWCSDLQPPADLGHTVPLGWEHGARGLLRTMPRVGMCFRVRERPGCAGLTGEEEEEDGRGGERPHLCCRPAPSAPGPRAPRPEPEPQVTPGHPPLPKAWP